MSFSKLRRTPYLRNRNRNCNRIIHHHTRRNINYLSTALTQPKPNRLLSNARQLNAFPFSSFGRIALPEVKNEPELHYAPGSPERQSIVEALARTRAECPDIPCVIDGQEVRTGDVATQVIPSDHGHTLCTYHRADEATLKRAIASNMSAKQRWESIPAEDRLAIFTKASWLLTHVHRADLMAATMLGTGKSVWQAEIDAAVELIDFWRFGPKFVQEMYDTQNLQHANGIWNKLEYRPLEGFCLAISPFNFCAIGGNLCATPAMIGNTVLWKPSSTSILSNYRTYQILLEAGLPPGVINFVPCAGALVSAHALTHPDLAAVNFTGSTAVFQQIWQTIGGHIASYNSYPRIIGETGGKNFHMLHESCDVETVVNATLRGSFEYQGQKCSATSRLYCPRSLWTQLKSRLIEETQKIKMGQPEDFEILMTAVIDANSFANIKSYVERVPENKNAQVIVGGHFDDSRGYFVSPTIIETSDPKMETMCDELFGPVLTCFVYEDKKYEETLELVNKTSPYALTGAIFARDRAAVALANEKLRQAAGNFYINDKCTGSVVGQQPFGGARQSGTNDKAGYNSIFYRFSSIRSIKENFLPQRAWKYPSMAL